MPTVRAAPRHIFTAIFLYIPFLCFNQSPGCLRCMFWVIAHLYCDVTPNHLGLIWLELSRQYVSVHFRIHLADSTLCHIFDKHQSHGTTGRHACPNHHTVSIVFYRWSSLLWIVSCSRTFPYFFLAIILVEINLRLNRPNNCAGVCRCSYSVSKVQSDLPVLELYKWFASCGEPSLYLPE